MIILFKKPERKLDSFLVPIRDKKNNKIRIRLTDDIVLQKILKVKDQNAHVIQCQINDEEVRNMIKQYDKDVMAHVLENCNLWFNTDLSDDKIKEMFLPSLSNHHELKTLVSSIIEPVVVLDHQLMTGFCEVLPIMESKSNLTQVRIILEIEAQGIYIRSRKFGIRWLVKSVKLFQDDIQPVEELFDISTCRDVTSSYHDDMIEVEQQVVEEIKELQKQINNLENYVQKLKTLVKDIENTDVEASYKEWITKTEMFTKLIWKYQRNRLYEK